MQKFVIVVIFALSASLCTARPANEQSGNNNSNISSTAGLPYAEEIVVESNLQVRKKDQTRSKRQFGGPGFGGPAYGQSNALANANSWGQYQRPGGFGSGAGIAGAQAFNSQGPLGGFGASAANTGTQGFDCSYTGGCSGSAGMSGSQTYNLPGGRNVNVAYGGTFGAGPGGATSGQSHGVTYS